MKLCQTALPTPHCLSKTHELACFLYSEKDSCEKMLKQGKTSVENQAQPDKVMATAEDTTAGSGNEAATVAHKEDVLFHVENLETFFPVKRLQRRNKVFIKAVNAVSLEIHEGETFGLVGESGCGKSTLGRSLIRILEPTGGKIIYRGQDITHIHGEPLQKAQHSMQIIFQDPYSSLNPFWTVDEILEEALCHSPLSNSEKAERKQDILHKVGMHREDLKKFPYEFSGGQRQRIGIARALMSEPDFIFCDEPIAALDVSIQAQVVNLLQDLQNELGLSYLFATHDLSMVRYISHRIGVMYLGRLVEVADSQSLYREPLHPYTKALLSAIPVDDPIKAAAQKRIHLEGEIPGPLSDISACPFASRCPYAKSLCQEVAPELRLLGQDHWAACHYPGADSFSFSSEH